MKLYFSPGACSMACHIALEEAGLPYEAIQVDMSKNPPTPPEFTKLNPFGAVPVLVMDDGQPLTENAVCLQYIADRKPEANLAPKPGTLERYRLQETMNFIATEVHKGFGPLWTLDYLSENRTTRDEVRRFTVASLGDRWDALSEKLGSREHLMPWGYTIADCYLFTMLGWTKFHDVNMTKWPKLTQYVGRMASRPAVQRVLKSEGLA